MRRRPVNTATALAVPSPTVTSRLGLPARGTIWMEVTSPLMRMGSRTAASAMGTTSTPQNRSCRRARSMSSVVDLSRLAMSRSPTRPEGTAYGPVARFLHWATFAALVAQFVVGYRLGEDAEDELEDILEDGGLVLVHVALGVGILALAALRLWWRHRAGLPPWSERLSPAQRTLAHRIEQVLYLCLFAAPLSGLLLVLVTDDALPLHIATHVLLLAAFAAHVALVLGKGLLRRML